METREANTTPGGISEALHLADEWHIDQRYAVIIGIDAYAEPIPRLGNACRDAQAVGELLARDYGFSIYPDHILLDTAATCEAIKTAVSRSLLHTATSTTQWLLYFAGHGSVVDGQGYFLPVDAYSGDPATYLKLSCLNDLIEQSPAAEVLIILDSCYSGRALVLPEQLTDLYPEGPAGHRVRQIVTSGNPDEPVRDGGGEGHSVFTQALLDVLGNWVGIHQSDGTVRFRDLLNHLQCYIPQRIAALGISNVRQQPVGGNLIGNRNSRDFVFRPAHNVPRLNPNTVASIRSGDPQRQRQSLQRLVEDCIAHPETKALAIELAKQYLSPEPVRALTCVPKDYPSVASPAVEVRAQAAIALGELGDHSALDLLVAALEDVPEVCRAAVRVLGKLADVSAAGPLLRHMREADDVMFLDFVGAIGNIGDQPTILGALRESLRRERLVPFVGPDFPQVLTGMPNRATLACKLAEKRGLAPDPSLAATARTAIGEKNTDEAFTALIALFTRLIKESKSDLSASQTNIFQALARLKSNAPLWISGAYDGLLSETLGAYSIVMGNYTKYSRPGRSEVISLFGDISDIRSLVLLEDDYLQLRRDEHDAGLLAQYTRDKLQGKVVLFLGYDPQSPDFALLVRHILNRHLAGVDAQAFIAWDVTEAPPTASSSASTLAWGDRPIYPVQSDVFPLVGELTRLASTA